MGDHFENKDHRVAQHDPYVIYVADDSLGDPPPPVCRRKYRVLHLFSGPTDRADGLAAYLRAVGIEVVDCDIVNVDCDDQDIADDAAWGRIKAKLQSGYFDFVFAGPPCRSFSASRGHGP
jgi:site-specific DNA-cytosine methylase